MKISLFKKGKTGERKIFKPRPTFEQRVKQDWLTMVIVFTILIVGVVGYDTYLFMRVNAGDFFISDAETQGNETAVTKRVILDAENYFGTRQKAYEAFVASPPVEIDPSL